MKSTYLSGKEICSLLNKECDGPIGYYLIPNKKDKLGILIKQFPDITVGDGVFSEAQEQPKNKVYPKEVYKILDTIKYTFFENDLIIKIKENLPIEEITIGHIYQVIKIPYAKSFIYYIKDFKKSDINNVLLSFAFSIYIERKNYPEEEQNQQNNFGGSFENNSPFSNY